MTLLEEAEAVTDTVFNEISMLYKTVSISRILAIHFDIPDLLMSRSTSLKSSSKLHLVHLAITALEVKPYVNQQNAVSKYGRRRCILLSRLFEIQFLH